MGEGGEHVEGTDGFYFLMASIFSVKLELRPRTEREEAEEVFVVQRRVK